MCALAEAFGFRLARVKGSHHIFVHPGIQDFVNLQNDKGYAKAYQVQQFLNLVEEYSIRMEGDEPGGQ